MGILRDIIRKELIKKGIGVENVLLVGEGEIGNWIKEKIEKDKFLGYLLKDVFAP